MGWAQKIEYVEVEPSLPAPVRKKIWDAETQTFVPMTLYRHMDLPNSTHLDWLRETYGHEGVYKSGRFWDYSRAGNYIVMDEKVYTWFQMKWGNK
jgi:hypothetical protein